MYMGTIELSPLGLNEVTLEVANEHGIGVGVGEVGTQFVEHVIDAVSA